MDERWESEIRQLAFSENGSGFVLPRYRPGTPLEWSRMLGR
jgi:hypothetical protein